MHAEKEEKARESRALADVLSASDEAKARRDFSEAARNRVHAAAGQHLEAKQKQEALRTDAEAPHGLSGRAQAPSLGDGGAPSAAAASSPTIDEMLQQRKALLDAGFDAEAEKVQKRLAQLRSGSEKERTELEQRIFKQRLASLEKDQQEQRDRLARTQAAELAEAESMWRDELRALTAAQAEENKEFELRITRAGDCRREETRIRLATVPHAPPAPAPPHSCPSCALLSAHCVRSPPCPPGTLVCAAALEEVELPRQLLKHRFKPSARLLGIRDALKRLPDDLTQANTAVNETKAKLLAQKRAVEQREVSHWREKFLVAALGSEPTSCIGQMLLAHKQAHEKAIDRQSKQRHALLKTQKEVTFNPLRAPNLLPPPPSPPPPSFLTPLLT